MGERKSATSTLHIHLLPALPDVFLVVRNAREPGAVPVIPTAIAEAYWAHPSNIDRRSIERPTIDTTTAVPR